MRVFTPVEVAEQAGNKYLGVLVAARFARFVNDFPRDRSIGEEKKLTTQSLEQLTAAARAPESATSVVGEMQLLIPMAGLIDKAAELARLDKQLERLGQDLARGRAKLENPDFVDKAPEAVVAKERARVDELAATLGQLQSQREKIAAI